MGLDMYLNASFYVSEYYDKELFDKLNSLDIPKLKNFKVNTIKAEALYWRKANQIHKWFVDNVQQGNDDCGTYYVEREKLQELRDLCVQVIANPDKAKELLPSQSGFFFGGTDYDENYLQCLEYTVKGLNKILEINEIIDFEYCSSW